MTKMCESVRKERKLRIRKGCEKCGTDIGCRVTYVLALTRDTSISDQDNKI